MDYKIYENLFQDEFIEKLLNYSNNNNFSEGKVGNRVDPKQKIRKDLFIKDENFIKEIDNIVYNNIYYDISDNFNINIKFRERWKYGLYRSEEKGFYKLHRDDILTTAYRKLSMTIALSDPNSYEGGEFYFPELNKSFKLKKGTLIVFRSSILHGVKEVTKGERCILAGFMFDSDGKKVKEKINKNLNINSYIPQLDNLKIEYSEYDKKNIIIKDNLNNENYGDIDYSDKYKNKLWTDKDDYYFENNSSDILLVTFAGMGWIDSLPTFIFYNFLKQYKNMDKLFLRDIKSRYYLTGLKNNNNSLIETLELIRELINCKKYKKIYAIGTSAGGFASILFGHLLNFDKVIAFSPQVVLNSKKDNIIEDKYNAPKTCKWLSSINLNDKFYHKCLDLKNFLPFNTNIDIHYAKDANKGIDKKHALYLESENCKIIEHDSKIHMLALELRDKGKLKEIIDELIE